MKTLTSDLSFESFADMSLTTEVSSALQKMKIDQPTLIQKKALPLAYNGSDLIGIAETGSGKTLVFALAILNRLQKDSSARALILTPSREMADQIFRIMNSMIGTLPISTCLVVAGMPEKPQVSQLNKNPRVIVSTPGRLLDHLSHNKLLLQKLSILVIDEADRMLDSGFGPQLIKIQATLRGDWQTLMFGASFGKAAQKFSETFFRKDHYLVRTDGAEKPVSNLKQVVIFTDRGLKKDRLLEVLKATKGLSVVFVKDQPTCESVHFHLKENGLDADMIHGDLKHGHRDRVVRDFRDEKFKVLVTTDLLARGFDIPNIELVVNFDLPNETEDFLHRIGRTARAGKKGKAITFVAKSDEQQFKQFKAYVEGAEEIN